MACIFNGNTVEFSNQLEIAREEEYWKGRKTTIQDSSEDLYNS